MLIHWAMFRHSEKPRRRFFFRPEPCEGTRPRAETLHFVQGGHTAAVYAQRGGKTREGKLQFEQRRCRRIAPRRSFPLGGARGFGRLRPPSAQGCLREACPEERNDEWLRMIERKLRHFRRQSALLLPFLRRNTSVVHAAQAALKHPAPAETP
jgi:hypothetical protein